MVYYIIVIYKYLFYIYTDQHPITQHNIMVQIIKYSNGKITYFKFKNEV